MSLFPAADMDYGPEVTASGCPHLRMKQAKRTVVLWRAGSVDPVVSQQRWITWKQTDKLMDFELLVG